MDISNVDPKNLELPELIAILTQNEVTLPETTQPRQFYEDLFAKLQSTKRQQRRSSKRPHEPDPNSPDEEMPIEEQQQKDLPEGDAIEPPAKKKARKSINPFQSSRRDYEETLIVNVAKDTVMPSTAISPNAVIPDTPVQAEKPLPIEEEREAALESQRTVVVESNKNGVNDGFTGEPLRDGTNGCEFPMYSTNAFGDCDIDYSQNSPIAPAHENKVDYDNISSPIQKSQSDNNVNDINDDDDDDTINDDDDDISQQSINHRHRHHYRRHHHGTSTSLSREDFREILYCRFNSFFKTFLHHFSPVLFGACFLTILFVFVTIYRTLVKVTTPYVFCDTNATEFAACIPCPDHGTCVGGALTCDQSYYRYHVYCTDDVKQYVQANTFAEKASKILGQRKWTHKMCGTPRNPCVYEDELVGSLGDSLSSDVWVVAKEKFLSRHKVAQHYDPRSGVTAYCTDHARSNWTNKCVFLTFVGWLESKVPDFLIALCLVALVFMLKRWDDGRKRGGEEVDRMFERACNIIKTEVTVNGRQYVLVSELHDAITGNMEKTRGTETKWKQTMVRLREYDAVKKGYAKINGRQVPVLSWDA